MRGEFIEERRAALERWSELVTGERPEGRVVRLPQRRRKA